MKKFIYVVAGLAFLFVAALIGIVVYLVSTQETDKNRKKTEAARAARWPKTQIPDNATQEEIDRHLDQLNQTNKTNEDQIQDGN